jgi:hypothetical protein
MIENIESIAYDNIELLNDSTFIARIHTRIDTNIEDIRQKLINAIATQTNKTQQIEFRDILIEEMNILLEDFKIEFKKGIAILSHLSDIENKTNLTTALNWYNSINEKITNELYQVLTILTNKINTLE